MKPRIMIVQPHIFMWGGAERQIANLANHLTDNNYRVTLLTMSAIPEFKRALKETRIVETKNFQKLAEISRALSDRFEIINTHNHPSELMFYPLKCKQVWQCNEPPEPALRGEKIDEREIEVVRKGVNKAVVISEHEKERFKSIYGFEPIVNYPGIRYDMFSGQIAIPPKFAFNDKFVILQSGYITWTKNQVRSVEILDNIRKTIPNAHLVIAGYDKDQYISQVKTEIQKRNLSENVTITGYIEDDYDMFALFKRADVHIAPIHDQGGYAVIFEGIVAGCPTIVSNEFTASKIMKDNNIGIVCDTKEFEEQILNIYSNQKQAKESVLKNTEWIKNNLTWKAFGQRYEQIFEEISWSQL